MWASVSLGIPRNKRHEERSFTLTLEQLVMNYSQMVEDDEARKRMERRGAGKLPHLSFIYSEPLRGGGGE